MSGFENSAGLSTYNFYGPRTSGEDNVGVFDMDGPYAELVIDWNYTDLNNIVTNSGSPRLGITKLPAGAVPIELVVIVDTAITTSTSAKDLYVGTEGSESTNGVTIADTDIDGAGTYIYTKEGSAMAGTWAAELAAATQIGVAFESDVTATAGAGRFILRYLLPS
jgi:hypothetical protein